MSKHLQVSCLLAWHPIAQIVGWSLTWAVVMPAAATAALLLSSRLHLHLRCHTGGEDMVWEPPGVKGGLIPPVPGQAVMPLHYLLGSMRIFGSKVKLWLRKQKVPSGVFTTHYIWVSDIKLFQLSIGSWSAIKNEWTLYPTDNRPKSRFPSSSHFDPSKIECVFLGVLLL